MRGLVLTDRMLVSFHCPSPITCSHDCSGTDPSETAAMRPSAMTTTQTSVYYDPYDFKIDTDPYPIWKRMRDEQPLYYNEKHDFFALSRFDDVERCSKDWRRYSS